MGLEKLKILLKTKGYSPESFAEKSGVPKSTIDKILSGITPDPRFNTVKQIANALDLSVDELVTYLDIEIARELNEITTIAAHHDGNEWTEEELEEIENFKKYVLSKRGSK